LNYIEKERETKALKNVNANATYIDETELSKSSIVNYTDFKYLSKYPPHEMACKKGLFLNSSYYTCYSKKNYKIDE
jgi:hypothetical protein